MRIWQKLVFSALLSVVLSLVCCGILGDDKEDKKESTGTDGQIPAEWDGMSDWSGSAFGVKDDE